MDDGQFAEFVSWVASAGLEGLSEPAMVAGFCERLVALGMPLARTSVIIDTLHPIYEGRLFSWQAEKHEATLSEYGRSDVGEIAERWRRSPLYHLAQTGAPMLRRRLTLATQPEFPIFADLIAAGQTDYVAMIHRFAPEGVIGDMECVYSTWGTDAQSGFSEADVGDLQRLVPLLALAVKAASLARIAETLVETYLGRDAGRRVLKGKIARGVADRIEAVLWFSDLQGYTRITDTAPPEQIIPLLNDYADAIISAVHVHDGEVLKLMGDGTLAIFTADDRGRACQAALDAVADARRDIAILNRRRAAEGLPTTQMYLGLHVGDVFYGNIGSRLRLDFTVVGPAVNEVSRIAALCRSVDQPVLVSSAFAGALGTARDRLVSVGRYALRGVGRPQDLFTLDPEWDTWMPA
jgi:adenylate cyclase